MFDKLNFAILLVSLGCIPKCGFGDDLYIGPNREKGDLVEVLAAFREYGRVEIVNLDAQVDVTLSEITDQQTRRQNAIDSLFMEFTYSQNRRFLLANDGVLRNPVAPNYSFRLRGGFSGIKQFKSMSDIVDGHETRPLVYAFDGRRAVLYCEPAAHILKGRAPEEMAPMVSMLNHLLVHVVPDERASRHHKNLFLPSLLTAASDVAEFFDNLFAIWRGQDQCNCLGVVSFPPVVMLGIDIVMLIGLWMLNKDPRVFRIKKGITLFRCIGQFVLVTALLSVVFPEYDTAVSVGIGGRRVLTPTDWVGEALPIVDDIELPRSLASFDHYDLVLVRNQCPKCSDALNIVFREFSIAPVMTIIIEIDYDSISERSDNSVDGPAILWGRLKTQRNWIVDVPCCITVKNGEVEKVRYIY